MHEVPLFSPAGFSVHWPRPSCSGWASLCWEEGPGHRQPKLTAPPRDTPVEGHIYNALDCPVWVMPSPLSLVSIATLDHVTSAMARGHGILRLWLHWDGVTWAVGESLQHPSPIAQRTEQCYQGCVFRGGCGVPGVGGGSKSSCDCTPRQMPAEGDVTISWDLWVPLPIDNTCEAKFISSWDTSVGGELG